MIANYHTHTPRCGHAQGSEEEYVRCAIEAGLHTLGFSDHTPYLFPDDYVPSFRMMPAELPGYVDAVLRMRKAYADQIRIHLGVEMEYYPKYFHDTVSFLRDNGIEYMILGQHFLYNEVEGIGSIGPTADPARLWQYCDQAITAMETGLFTYFAHPDLMLFVGDRGLYRQEIRRLCQAANACRIPLEINLLGLREGRHYPNPAFWDIAAEEGCTMILGRDAHSPQMLLDQKTEQMALELAQTFGMTPIETIVPTHI